MNHLHSKFGIRIALSILLVTVSGACAEKVSPPPDRISGQSFKTAFSDLPDQAAFYPERIACTVQKNPKKAWDSIFPIPKENYTEEDLNATSMDRIFDTLRSYADQGNAELINEYFYFILFKNEMDRWDLGFYGNYKFDSTSGKQKSFRKKFVKEFHDISVLAMSYAYVFFSLQPAEVPAEQKIAQLSASKATEIPPEWVAEAKAAGERWKYLCAHPDERQAEIEKSDRLPLCPKYVDKNRENWEPTPKSPEEVPAWRERMGFGEDKPAPQVLQGCLPRPPEAPEIHIARPL